MLRGYDSGVVLQEDIIERVKHLRDEIAASEGGIDKLKKQAAVRERRIERLKKEVRPCYST
ncbi:MAG: hypothetical protein V3T60_14620 [Candidatus Binatia bacterium]